MADFSYCYHINVCKEYEAVFGAASYKQRLYLYSNHAVAFVFVSVAKRIHLAWKGAFN